MTRSNDYLESAWVETSPRRWDRDYDQGHLCVFVADYAGPARWVARANFAGLSASCKYLPTAKAARRMAESWAEAIANHNKTLEVPK